MSEDNPYMRLSPGPSVPGIINAIVEIPKGRRNKFELDKKTGMLKLDRYLYASAHYPGDYGLIPQTLAEDGDPLDVLVMVNEPTFPGCLIEARPLGLFRMTDDGDNDFKILAVPHTDPIFAEYDDLWRIPPHYLREVEHFFGSYKELEKKVVRTQGWDGQAAAHQEIASCIERYREQRGRAPEGEADKMARPKAAEPRE